LGEIQVDLENRVGQRSVELEAAGQALSQSEARLALALKASELGLWDWNLQTDEVHHTHIQELFGLAPEQVTALLRHLKPRLHPDDLPALKRALVEHLKGRTEDYQIEYRVRHGDGHWVWIEDRGRAVERADNGRVIRMVGTRRDISVGKAQEEQLQLAATVFEAASEGIVIFDPGVGWWICPDVRMRAGITGRSFWGWSSTAIGRVSWWKPARMARCIRNGCN